MTSKKIAFPEVYPVVFRPALVLPQSPDFALELHPLVGNLSQADKVSTAVLQICYLVDQAREDKRTHNFQDGHWWTYQSIRGWRDKFFKTWSIGTISVILQIATDLGLIVTGNYNHHDYDRTIWYRPNYETLAKFKMLVVQDYDPPTIPDLETEVEGVQPLNTPVQPLNTPVQPLNDDTIDSSKTPTKTPKKTPKKKEEEEANQTSSDSHLSDSNKEFSETQKGIRENSPNHLPDPKRLPMTDEGEVLTDLDLESFTLKLFAGTASAALGYRKPTFKQRQLIQRIYHRAGGDGEYAAFVVHQIEWCYNGGQPKLFFKQFLEYFSDPYFEKFKESGGLAAPAGPLEGMAKASDLKEHPLSLKFTASTGLARFRDKEWDQAIADMLKVCGDRADDVLEMAWDDAQEWPDHMRVSGPWSLVKTMAGLREEAIAPPQKSMFANIEEYMAFIKKHDPETYERKMKEKNG